MPIFDQGYQHWNGHLSSHAWRWLAIARHGVRVGFRARFLRIFLLFAWAPAIALAAVLCLWGLVEQKSQLVMPIVDAFRGPALNQMIGDPQHWRVDIWTLCYRYFMAVELYVAMFLVLMIGPNLISQDLRFNALPLYLSRPLRRIDYFLGKLAVVVAFIGMVTIVPAVIAYLLGLLFSLDISIIKDTLPVLIAAIVYGLIIALSAGLLILALSSITRNSRYVALMWLALLFLGWMVASTLGNVAEHQRRREFYTAHHAGSVNFSGRYHELQAAQLEDDKSDWRPLLSYTANLRRVGEWLLGVEASSRRIGEIGGANPVQQAVFVRGIIGSIYPWYWSAGVLAGLALVSAWILNRSVKSLDRLK